MTLLRINRSFNLQQEYQRYFLMRIVSSIFVPLFLRDGL